MKKILQYFKNSQWLLLLTWPLLSIAQEEQGTTGYSTEEMLAWAIMAIEVIIMFVVILLYFVIRLIGKNLLDTPEEKATENAELENESLLDRTLTRWNDAIPIEREAEVLTDHAYDGIQELDNNLPPWWKTMFYASIVFAVAYLSYFHLLDAGDSQAEEYEKEMAAAQAEVEAYLAANANNIDETNVTLLEDADKLASGKEIFVQKCAPCHGQEGQGGVGPNLTDQYWLHGGDIKDVFKTIKNGVPEKGMIPWKAQLAPSEMQEVASFIISLEGSNPPNPKEPQGEMYERNQEVAIK